MCVLCYFTYDAKVSPLSLLNTLKTLYVFTALYLRLYFTVSPETTGTRTRVHQRTRTHTKSQITNGLLKIGFRECFLRAHLFFTNASSTSGPTVMATKRSIVDNATSGIAPPPRAWSIQTGQCSGTRPPLGAVSPSRKRDHEAARSNRRDAPSSVPVTSQWCAQDGAGQPARTAWPPRRHPSRGSS